MKGNCRVLPGALRATFAASVLVLAGCSTAGKGAKPQAPPRPAAVQHPQRPQPEIIEPAGPWAFQSLPFAGMVWEWLGNLTPTETMKVEQPDKYLLKLKSDGWFEVQTDCRQGEGMYETRDQRIAMAVVRLTDAACPPGSHHDLYLKSLESAGSFRMTGEKLYFDMTNEAKTMVFWRIK
jgi:hypothetical protein